MTKYCSFRVSSGEARSITDSSTKTVWSPSHASGTCYIQIPQQGAAGYLQIEWNVAPDEGCAVIQYDANQTEVASAVPNGNLVEVYPLSENTQYIFIQIRQEYQGLCGAKLYSRGDLPADVQNWDMPYEKCDLMVISTHQDDEWLWFGGIIPYYEHVMGKRVQVVYMAKCSRVRYAEALDGLWLAKHRNFPVFLGFKDERIESLKQSVADWGGADYLTSTLAALIRAYKPDVILTHDWNGEYKHPQHIVTSRAMDYAIEAAADPNRYPDSANLFGAWQVKKLYRHLEKKNQIKFDWNAKYQELGGYSPLDICKAAYKKHEASRGYFQVGKFKAYDNSLFGLSYSTVGEDSIHRDLFENIPGNENAGQTEAFEPNAFDEIPEDAPEPVTDASGMEAPIDVPLKPEGN